MKVDVVLKVDDEVKAVCDSIVKEAQDLHDKIGLVQQGADLFAGLSPVLGTLANLPADVKASKDNRKYIMMALDEVAEVFITIQPPAPKA